MPPVETMDLRQKAQLWGYSGYNTSGDPTVSAQEEISCRWSNVTALGSDAGGNPITYDATVITDQSIPAESIMYEGDGDDYDAEVSPTYYQVKKCSLTPDIKGRNTRHELALVRYGDTLPTVE